MRFSQQIRIPPWIILLAALLVAAGASYALVRLIDAALQGNQAVTSLTELQADSQQLNALEWQTIAKQELTPDIAARIDATNRDTDRIMASLSRPGAGFELPADVIANRDHYQEATSEEFRLLRNGQINEAVEVDKQQVDPAFETLNNSIVAARANFQEQSQTILHRTYIGSAITAVAAALVIGLLFWQFERVQRNSKIMNEREKVLSQSEQRLRSLIEKGADIINVLDPRGKILYASPSIANVLGYRVEDFLGRDILERVHPDDAGRLNAALAHLIEGGNPARMERPVEFRFRHEDGTWRALEGTGSNLLNDVNVRGLVLNVRDVTERHLADEQIRASEERYRTLAEAAQEDIFIFDREGSCLYANDFFARKFGLIPQELIGKPATETLPSAYAKLQQRFVGQVFETGDPIQLDIRLPGARDVQWVEASLTPIRKDGGDISAVLGIARDITERITMERDLQEKEAGLAEAQRLARIGSWDWDLATDEIRWSDEMCDIFELAPGDAGISEILFNLMQPEERDPVSLESVLAGDRRLQLDRELELPGGGRLFIHVEGKVVRGKKGKPARLMGTMQDVTAQKLANAALADSERRYRNLLELSPDEIVAIDLESRLLFANSRAAEMHGFDSVEEMLQTNMLDLFTPEDRPRAVESMNELGSSGKIDNEEFSFLRKDGSRFPAEVNATLVADAEGQPMVISTIRDISERKLVEDEMQHMADDLSFVNLLNDASNRGDSLVEMLELMAREIRTMFGCSAAGVYLTSDGGEELRMQSFIIPPARLNLIERVVSAKLRNMDIRVKLTPGSIHGRLMEQTRVTFFNDPEVIEKIVREYADTLGLTRFVPRVLPVMNMKSILTISLVGRAGPVCMLGFASDRLFTGSDMARIESITEHLSVIVERRLAEESLRRAS